MSSKKILLTIITVIIIISLGLLLKMILKSDTIKNIGNEHDYESNIDFVDDEVFEMIADAYSKIDFMGEFEKGNVNYYDFYKRQYLRLLKCEITFFHKQTQKEYYINEFGEMNYSYPNSNNLVYDLKQSNIYDPNNYIYYFFDMDSDGVPELCVTNEIRFIYIFKYETDSNRFILWHEIPTTWIRLLGSKKLCFYGGGTPVQYAYFKLNENGEEEYSVRFYLKGYYNIKTGQDDTMYMISLPAYATDNINDLYYFRVSEQQWKLLTNSFFKARELAQESLKEISFTYETLFFDTDYIENQGKAYFNQ